jgi:hypothetical protein
MTDIEAKARDMVRKEDKNGLLNFDAAIAALCRAIEQHEAFKQEVSNAVVEYYGGHHNASGEPLERFIIPKPQPDPLVEALDTIMWTVETSQMADEIRAALEARGLEIREKGQ